MGFIIPIVAIGFVLNPGVIYLMPGFFLSFSFFLLEFFFLIKKNTV